MSLEKVKYSTDIKISSFPIKWLSQIQFFDPYLPQYPIVYVHFVKNNIRVYGFPVYFSVEDLKDDNCSLVLKFLSNIDLESNPEAKKMVSEELENRLGISDKIDKETIIKSCNGNEEYEKFFSDVWDKFVTVAYGKFIPFGRIYDEMFSIVRFIAAINSASGRKSEMQMVYDFMSKHGENVGVSEPWSNLEFYVIPTYDEIINKDIKEFTNYSILISGMEKVFNEFFTGSLSDGRINLMILKKQLAKDGKLYREMIEKMHSSGILNIDEKEALSFLLDAFNRYPSRAEKYISSVININKKNDYRNWGKNEIMMLYSKNSDSKGFSPKAAGCFIQQGFGKEEIIPIDEWVESFCMAILNIEKREEFLRKFIKMGKLERLIWFISQSRKTNMALVFDAFWCIKYGTTFDTLRMQNPISCYICSMRDSCVGYRQNKNCKVLLSDAEDIKTKESFNKSGKKIKYISLDNKKIEDTASINGCKYILATDKNNTPKRVFKKIGNDWALIDEYSGYFLHKEKTDNVGKIIEMEKIIQELLCK